MPRGRPREEVEKCLNVYLKIPGMPKGVAKALLARGSLSGEGSLAKAQLLPCGIPLNTGRTPVVQPGSQLGCNGVSSSPAFYVKDMFNLYR